MKENNLNDHHQRQLALNPAQSFIVQAPAGSGKTELLIQRFLVLLGSAQKPEEILAITFTKKSAAEMRERIITAITQAKLFPEPETPHAKKTWQLARNVLARDAELQWQLLLNPNRLRIQTIDSFNATLTKHLPILSHFGATPEIINDATPLYQEAIQELLLHLEENVAWSDAIAQLLLHLDNDLNQVAALLVNMLRKRDQWLPHIMAHANDASLRILLETNLKKIITDHLDKLVKLFPKEYATELLALIEFATLSNSNLNDYKSWLTVAELLLTKEFSWRKSFNKNQGFPVENAHMKQRMLDLIESLSKYEPLRAALQELKLLPQPEYQEAQWETLKALHQLLQIAVAQLKLIFQKYGKIDYIENAAAALTTLGTDEEPTDLALALDYKIHHILIDEFQDTSHSQYRLLEKLILGWQPNDGRTLFVVGDPMQSIYRFREAEVGLFIRARKDGIGHIALTSLTLTNNFRSVPKLIAWVNTHFLQVLASNDDIATGAVSFSASTASKPDDENHSAVMLHSFMDSAPENQAEKIIALITESQQKNPTGSIAILVRSRSHLRSIIPALKNANIAYQAINIDPLSERPVIQDLVALTRALLHPADRIAWLSILRAPWCGLTLNDLLLLSGDYFNQTLFQTLSDDGQTRLARIFPILKSKIADRGRYSLRLWVESTWLLLGGPACVDALTDLDDANVFFELLEKLDEGGELTHFDYLNEYINQLYATPQQQNDQTLQIMTIHNAKGLEFDTVILPHLERKISSDKKQLLHWMEQNSSLILAPVHAIGEDSDSIYEYIKHQHAIKTDYEMGRLLYVAATRAKKELHLLFNLESDEKPIANSLLEKIWPAIKHTNRAATVRERNTLADARGSVDMTSDRNMKRLAFDWTNPIHETEYNPIYFHQKNNGFQLLSTTPRLIGILIHQILQMLSRLQPSWWQDQPLHEKNAYIKNHLIQLGILISDLPAAINTVHQAINNTLQDERGRWILHNHSEAEAELQLTAVIDAKITSLIIDRTFVDESGIRWIIDYKTAIFNGENLEEFLLQEEALYKKQLQQYHQALQNIDSRPIRLALYFPMIPAWKEILPPLKKGD